MVATALYAETFALSLISSTRVLSIETTLSTSRPRDGTRPGLYRWLVSS